MHIILGATGHIGSALSQALLAAGEPILVLTRNLEKAEAWRGQGAQAAVVDVADTEALRRVFRMGQRLFLLNPPAPPSADPATEERRTLASILAALEGSGLEKIVAESTYGAQPGDQIGDLGVLYEMEQALAAQPIPTTILRGAYYLSNWDAALNSARREGVVASLYPTDFSLPMVAPEDIGRFAAGLLRAAPARPLERYEIEGPERYTPADVAAAFAQALDRPVQAHQIPRAEWREALQAMGFSEAAATSFIGMTEATLAGPARPEQPARGATSLQEYIDAVVAKNPSQAGD